MESKGQGLIGHKIRQLVYNQGCIEKFVSGGGGGGGWGEGGGGGNHITMV